MIQLRDIEILVQQQLETLEGEGKDDVTLRDIQKILYSTEVSTVPQARNDSLKETMFHSIGGFRGS